MKIVTAALFVICTAIAATAQQGQERAQGSPVFRTAVELTVVLVNVIDRDTQPAGGLTQNDFVLLENGTPKPLSHFLGAEGAVDVALLVDLSSSITPVLADLRRTAADFVEALRPDDRVMVVGFDRRVRSLSQLTDDRQQLERALQRLRPSGSTSFFDSLYITVKTLASTSTDFSRRKAIVVLSDGEDTSSILQAQEVREQSRRYGIPIFMILMDPTIAVARSRVDSYKHSRRRFEMKALAGATGGRAFIVDSGAGLKEVYRSIAQALSQQYLLAYECDRTRGEPRITVQIPSRPAAKVQTHVGYVERTARGG